MDREKLERQLAQLPLYGYSFLNPQELEFTERVRFICRQECAMYGKTWACPPGVGTVEECRERCLGYDGCLMLASAAEVPDPADLQCVTDTRQEHEVLTDQVAEWMAQLGEKPYGLSAQACAVCRRCAWLDGLPCRFPEQMRPCVESHGINVVSLLEKNGIDFQQGDHAVIWVSLLFY